MSGDQATMNLTAVRSIADAVLYEGYILYPYRASSQKNQSRWQFGVVMAPGYAAADPSETSFTQAECVLEHTGQPVVQVILRFLQVQRRTTEGSGPGPGTRRWSARSRSPRTPPRCSATAWSRSSPSPAARTVSRSTSPAARMAPAPVRGPPPGAAGRRGLGAGDPPARPVARGPAAGPGGEPDHGQPRAAAPGGRPPVGADRGAHDHQRFRRGVHLDDRPADLGAAGRGRVPERGRLAGAGRPRRRSPGRAVLADHPVRPPGARRGEPGRALRRHRDRRDPHAAHPRALRRREGRGPGHRPAGGRTAGPGRVHGRGVHGAAARHHPLAAPGPRRPARHHRPARAPSRRSPGGTRTRMPPCPRTPTP